MSFLPILRDWNVVAFLKRFLPMEAPPLSPREVKRLPLVAAHRRDMARALLAIRKAANTGDFRDADYWWGTNEGGGGGEPPKGGGGTS